jgi:acyl transferase domain-containing protein/3-hydroxymyristoyl/3-hydroxydecanoyl-(acyl carrier protein) dehydratase
MPVPHRIAIVGMGGIFPSAGPAPTTAARLWDLVLGAIDASRDVPAGRWLLPPERCFAAGAGVADRVYSKRGYFIDPFTFDAAGLDLPVELLAELDPLFHLTLYAGTQAFDPAATATLDRRRVGVILGNIALPTEKASALAREYLGRTFAEKAHAVPMPRLRHVEPLNRYVAGLPAGVLAKALGLGGGAFTLDAACASSLYAVLLAAEELRAGRVDAMLAGGVARPDCLYTQMGFSQLRALAPSGRAAPFDARADGLVVGEGAGVFLLKRLDDALAAGDRILAVLVAGGLSNDMDGGLLAPSSAGQLRAMQAAYRQAGWAPQDVDMIECHATGTPVGDAVEFHSLQQLWQQGGRRGQCVLGSIKSTVGHLLTGAGAAGLVKVIAALQAKTLPPTANFDTPAVGIDLDASPFRILKRGAEWPRRDSATPRRAAISGFGFGGINAHLLLEEWDAQATSRSVAVSAVPASPVAVAIVGLDAQFGRWPSLAAFQQRVLGSDAEIEPHLPRHWWGVAASAWFQREGVPPEEFAGFFMDEVVVAAERFRIPPRELREMLPQQLLMLQLAARVLEGASIPEERRERTGVYIGLGLDLNTTNFHFRWSVEDEALRDAAGPPLTANRTMGALGSVVASRIAREFGFGGPSFTISSEESSGLRALEVAVRALQRGDIDQAIVGAVDLASDVRALLATQRRHAFSTEGGARPFDVDAAGTTAGEGAAVVVLRRLEEATRNSERVFAVLKGIGVATGGAIDQLAPTAAAYREALTRAYADAAVAPASIDFVECHGSGTPAEDRAEAQALASFFAERQAPLTLGSAKADIGHAGAAGGLASLVKACLCLDRQILPPLRNVVRPRPELLSPHFRLPHAPSVWLRDRSAGPRRAGVSSMSVDGNCVHVVLEEHSPAALANLPERVQPLGALAETIFAIEAADAADLLRGLEKLRREVTASEAPLDGVARAWPRQPDAPLAVVLLSRGRAELLERIDAAHQALSSHPEQRLPASGPRPLALAEGVFYSPQPLGPTGQLAFVYPGSGNDFPGMGRDVAVRWPEVLRRQDLENERLRSQMLPHLFWEPAPATATARERIFGQVTFGCLVTDLLRSFGVCPHASIGLSLGESAALFALRVWTDRDLMWRDLCRSPLFASDLTGRCDAARRTWELPDEVAVDWFAGVVDRTAAEVRGALVGRTRVYLLIINAPRECIVGGERAAVLELVDVLGCQLHPLPETSTAHCAVARAVSTAYRALHYRPTTSADGAIRFYSSAHARVIDLAPDAVADALLAQAVDTVDFPAVIEAAYRDGVRLFVEIGPGASCTRAIGAILGARPHFARSASGAGSDGVSTVLRLLAQLIAERVPVDLAAVFGPGSAPLPVPERTITVPIGGEPFVVPVEKTGRKAAPSNITASPSLAVAASYAPAIAHAVTAHQSIKDAHAAYLRLTATMQQSLAQTLAFQTGILEALLHAPPPQRSVAFDRAQCLEFAVGSIAGVLGPEYAAADTYPTRVRLPDEPLMLVDRILSIEALPRSLSSGRVITEHDIHAGAWYLDAGRIPTCIAVEAGQADLFLSGYLGIDLHTRGLAVYRLLDAVVTFHRGLPGPGEVIHYDIHIDQFFRQGETHLFRFRFEGTVGGAPLLSMTAGCAGFFTAAALAAGKGIVHTELDHRPSRGLEPDTETWLPALTPAAYTAEQIEALRRGDAAGCFGPAFADVTLPVGLRLPGGRMKLVDRVTHLEPRGGRFGLGLIRAEADIDPEAWFLTCHFIDDRVMPGTLMYECCLHTLRIFLLRLGWIGAEPVACEPVPGVASQLKCRGQVTQTTRTVTYEITLKERGYRPEPYALVDALMYADGKPIVEILNMSIRLTGLTRASIQAFWHQRGAAPTPLFDYDRILAFAIGKPSEAFGEPYRIFDEERVIARLPGPPYQFLDRIMAVDAEPFKMVAGGTVLAHYDVPPDAWYFTDERQDAMPFAVLLEVALQPCGWLAAYVGSALTSPTDLSFRNLGGTAELFSPVRPDAGTLTTTVKLTRVATSGGMIIQNYDFEVRRGSAAVYRGETTFGFFSKDALAQQVGIRDAKLYEPGAAENARGEAFAYPQGPPWPAALLRTIDRIEIFVADGGPAGLGLIRGAMTVEPSAWFFKAHFYQDPVIPGSLGLESLLQLLKVVAVRRWGGTAATSFDVMRGAPHQWIYRGQVIPSNQRVTVQAVITARDDSRRRLTADGFLLVDGRAIYQMRDFTLSLREPEHGRF